MEEETNNLNISLTEWYIDNAGLILTHPFLIQLFKVLEYLNEENQFKNETLQFRAVYLLHYMATGQNSSINESELAISKLFCGLQFQDSIPFNVVLLNTEKAQADDLLTALISMWEKLGNTSLEGLRNSFLSRAGVLEKKDRVYHLSLETSGIDILLDYIPWNISMVKLPWLKPMIYCSWRQ